MRKFFIILLFFFVRISFAQSDYVNEIGYNLSAVGFSVASVNYMSDNPGLTKVEFFIQVPYSAVQFLKKGFRFNSKYTLTLKIENAVDESPVDQDIWTEKLTVRDFDKTQSESSFNLSRKSYNLKPGDYKVTCILEDENSQVKEKRNAKITVRKINSKLDISDIMLISKIVRGKHGDQVIPNVDSRVTSKSNELPFFFELYSDKERDLDLEFVLRDKMRNQSFKYPATKKVSEGKNLIYHKIDNVAFTLGEYTIQVNLHSDTGSVALGTIKKFTSSYKGIPSTVTNLGEAIDQMIYIASSGVVDSLESEPDYNVRLEKFVSYWKRHDPTPGTEKNEVMEEYYARVAYANSHFNSYYEGWKSDMGWIFITLGPPDYVYRQPMAMDEKTYEIWTYYEVNRTFKFTDETGFGHYRLVNPQYGDWLRYRY
jgi:GWxTD domain-containing protein